jgi:acyl dehydratase
MELDVKGPVVAGDTVHVEVTVTEIRPTAKGGRGLVRTKNEIKNQRGEIVIVYTPLRLLKGKSDNSNA